MRDERLKDIPLILETPINDDPGVWQKEIEVMSLSSRFHPRSDSNSRKVLYKLQKLTDDDESSCQSLSEEIAVVVRKSASASKAKEDTKKTKKATSIGKTKGDKWARKEESEEDEDDK